jgi:CBS domain-containing protein
MSDDLIDEEMQIMQEQDAEPKVMNSEMFKLSIHELRMPAVKTLDCSATIGDAIDMMQKNRIGSVVITKDGKLEGIVTERDVLLKVIGLIENYKTESITKVMTADPVSLMPGDAIAYALNNMHVGGYRHVPIVNEENEPISLVSIKDVVSFIMDYFPEEITNLTGTPFRGPVTRDSA